MRFFYWLHNNTQIDNAKYIDVIMPTYNSIEYSDNYSVTSGSLWRYYRDESVLTDAGAFKNFHVGNNNSALFKFKQKSTGVRGDNSTKDVEIIVLLKYLSNFCWTLEMPFIDCKINLISTNDAKATTFGITDIKLYDRIVALSTRDNAKLLEQLKS